MSVCVSVNKIFLKILNRSTPFSVEAFPVTQGGNHAILKKKTITSWDKGGPGGGGGVEIWP